MSPISFLHLCLSLLSLPLSLHFFLYVLSLSLSHSPSPSVYLYSRPRLGCRYLSPLPPSLSPFFSVDHVGSFSQAKPSWGDIGIAWRLALQFVGPRVLDLAQQKASADHSRNVRAEAIVARDVAALEANTPPSSERLVTAACLLLGAAGILGIARPRRKDVPMSVLQTLAFMPRFRGSGQVAEQSRSLQNRSVALVGVCALRRQEFGLRTFLERQEVAIGIDNTDTMRATAAMWGGAAQKARSIKQQEYAMRPALYKLWYVLLV